MGMDLYFNKKQAIAAGLEIRQGLSRGTAQEIVVAEMLGDPDYLEYLREQPDVIKVPDTSFYVEVTLLEDNMAVRANPWGPVYAPLTQFLKEHDISWVEA